MSDFEFEQYVDFIPPGGSSGQSVSTKLANSQTLFDTLRGKSDKIDQETFVAKLKGYRLFTDGNAASVLRNAFVTFDEDKDDALNRREFENCYGSWIKPLFNPSFKPRTALLIVDVQHDFIDGSLALRNCPNKEEGYDVVPVINKLLETVNFDAVVYTQDWHPADHCSFIENATNLNVHCDSKISKEDAKSFDFVTLAEGNDKKYEIQLFPAHTIEDTPGAKFHKDLTIVPDALFVQKGTNSHRECFSAFLDTARENKTNLDEVLMAKGITRVLTCGIAYEFCVGNTTLDAVDFGYDTVFINDAVRGVNDETKAGMKKRMDDKSVHFTTSDKVGRLLSGSERPSLLGQQKLDRLKKTV